MDKDITRIITSVETYGEVIQDSCFSDNVIRRGPKGYVKIFEKSDGVFKPFYETSNIVVYRGREFVAQKIVGVNSGATPTKDDVISWLGVGSGGAPIGHELQPTAPQASNTDLATPVMINATDTLCADNRSSVGGYLAGRYKHPFESVTFATDPANNDSKIIIKFTTTIGKNDANGTEGAQYLNEAGLFSSTSKDAGIASNFNLFARITFPTFVKDDTRSLAFIWYVYL